MQLIWIDGLSFSQNLWLKSLNTPVLDVKQAEHLVQVYGKHKHENLYKSVMNVIVNKNKRKFMEVKYMCEALEELMKEELEEMRIQGMEEGRAESEKEIRELKARIAELERERKIQSKN